MELWFTIWLFGCSLLILSWYCHQLAQEKGYLPWLFALFGLVPLLNFISLLVLYLLPDKNAKMHQVYFSKHRQRP